MTKVKGRLGEWIEAKMRALAAPATPLPALIEKAPPHIRVIERTDGQASRHAKTRRSSDSRGHRSSRSC